MRVYATADHTAGMLMRGRLEAEGISVMLKGEGEGPYRAGPVFLWVAPEDEAAAIGVIDAVESGAFAIDENADVGVEEPDD